MKVHKLKFVLIVSTILLSSLVYNTEISFGMRKSVAQFGEKRGSGVTPPVNPMNPDDPEIPNDSIDTGNLGTGERGPLSIDMVPNLDFGKQTISAETKIYSARNQHSFVQISNKRGTEAGWELVASVGEFKSVDGTDVLKGAELSMMNGQVKTMSENVSDRPQTNSAIIFVNQESQSILNSVADSGRGTWLNVWSGNLNNNQSIQLKVLGNSAKPVNYTATIKWTLVSGPEND